MKAEPSKVKSGKTTPKMEKHRTEKTGGAAKKFYLDFKPEIILGATEIEGKIQFRIKVKDSEEWKIVKARIAHAVCPQLVIEFYEKNLILDGQPFVK